MSPAPEKKCQMTAGNSRHAKVALRRDLFREWEEKGKIPQCVVGDKPGSPQLRLPLLNTSPILSPSFHNTPFQRQPQDGVWAPAGLKRGLNKNERNNFKQLLRERGSICLILRLILY